MKKYKPLFLGMLLVLVSNLHELYAQQVISIDQCYQWAEEYYPLAKQKGLNDQYSQVQLDIIEAEKKPSISWNAQASLQSEALKIEFPMPGTEPIELPVYKLQTTLDAGYLIWDGGLAEARKDVEKAGLVIKNKAVDVELYQLKDRIDQYFWGVVLLDIQDEILFNASGTIDSKLASMEAAAKHGVVLPSQIKKLQVEKLKLETKTEAIAGKRKSLLSLLSEATGQNLSLSVELVLPELPPEVLATTLERPEQALFDFQKQQILSNKALLDAKNKPKVSAFLQAGLGYPNPLNFFDEEISPFAIGGVRFSWNFMDWGKSEKQEQALQIQAQLVDNKRETFEFNLNALKGRYEEEVATLERQILKDKEIVLLQEDILKDYSSQLDNGIITTTDYTTQLNEVIQARLQLEVHKLQIQQLKSDYLTKMGR
jgi:outer membrane protein TolC